PDFVCSPLVWFGSIHHSEALTIITPICSTSLTSSSPRVAPPDPWRLTTAATVRSYFVASFFTLSSLKPPSPHASIPPAAQSTSSSLSATFHNSPPSRSTTNTSTSKSGCIACMYSLADAAKDRERNRASMEWRHAARVEERCWGACVMRRSRELCDPNTLTLAMSRPSSTLSTVSSAYPNTSTTTHPNLSIGTATDDTLKFPETPSPVAETVCKTIVLKRSITTSKGLAQVLIPVFLHVRNTPSDSNTS
ncbi:hypothetical protein M427DRAFT_352603, partial [Gonapodya prolifera JEL478]